MLRQRQKSIGIALAIFSLFLFGINNSSDALEILSLYPTANTYDWGNGGWHSARVEVDEGDCYVSWYMQSSNQDIEHLSTTWISEPNRSATFGDYFSGDITGEEYTIGAYLRKYREDVGLWQVTPFTTYDTKVYKPEFEAYEQLGVSGSVYLYSLDYSHPYITPTGEVYTYNNSNAPRTVFHRFRHLVTGPNHFKIDREDITNGEPKHIPLPDSGYSASIPSRLSISIDSGEPDGEYRSLVYMRLEVAGFDEKKRERKVDWFAGADEWFTRDDEE